MRWPSAGPGGVEHCGAEHSVAGRKQAPLHVPGRMMGLLLELSCDPRVEFCLQTEG